MDWRATGAAEEMAVAGWAATATAAAAEGVVERMGRRVPRGIELMERRRLVARGLAAAGAGAASAARIGGLEVRPRGAELIGRRRRAARGLAAAETGMAGAAWMGGAAEAGKRTAKRRAILSLMRAVVRAQSARGVPRCAKAMERAKDAVAEAWQARERPCGSIEMGKLYRWLL